MARILVVDDDAINRRLLVALLSYDGHLTIEAGDGDEGVALAKVERPQLVISDIVMPTMDGFGLVRELRSDPALHDTKVIFYTATYHEREAQQLAKLCQVDCVIVKPCEPSALLSAVAQALAGMPESKLPPLDASFDREHLVLVTNKLAERTNALEASRTRLVALAELGVQLAAETDPEMLMGRVCAGARKLIGSRYAILTAWRESAERPQCFRSSGIGNGGRPLSPPIVISAPWIDAIRSGRAWRGYGGEGECVNTGLPPDYPPATAFLAVPLQRLGSVFGWLAVADKLGGSAFNEDDERTLIALVELSGRLYDNGACLRELARLNTSLREAQEESRKRVEYLESLLERMYSLWVNLNTAILAARNRDELCAEVCRLLSDWGNIRSAEIDLVSVGSGPAVLDGGNRASLNMVCNDLRADGQDFPRRQALLSQGYGALAVLPLTSEGGAMGRLVLLAEECGSFDEFQVKVLSEVGRTVAAAMSRIDARANGVSH